MRTPYSRVHYLGSAHEGTGHFWRQRLTGAALVVLTLVALVIIIATVGKPYEEAVTILGSPFAAAALVLLIAATAIHMRIGMQVIIEDYVIHEGWKVVCLGANTLFSAAVGVVAVLAILKLSFGS
jgi:succinate dehydrogenase / fumarate reductase membrane anchor subunit